MPGGCDGAPRVTIGAALAASACACRDVALVGEALQHDVAALGRAPHVHERTLTLGDWKMPATSAASSRFSCLFDLPK